MLNAGHTYACSASIVDYCQCRPFFSFLKLGTNVSEQACHWQAATVSQGLATAHANLCNHCRDGALSCFKAQRQDQQAAQ